jgi:uncharacterized protein involved in exopolysaccharide biosynthesis
MSQNRNSSDFARQASSAQRPSLPREFLSFLLENKKWWLGPILVVIVLVAVLAITAGPAAAPFIYTLF